MPFYSEELIEEVQSRNDIVDVVSGYVRLQKKGSSYFGLCPFHNEKTPSFSVSQDKQMYYCFGCGAGGNVFTFLMDYENYSFPEAIESLAQRAGMDLPKQGMDEQARAASDKRMRLLEINKAAAKYYYAQLRAEQGRHALDYLTGRCLSEETIRKFGLGYSQKSSNDLYQYLRGQGYGDMELQESGLVTLDERRGPLDRFWNRVMFPIMDINNHVIGFGGRVMGDGEPKYVNSPETMIFDKGRNLYGLNIARNSRKPQILLCEGYMDVIALHQAGFDNAVAALGTSFTQGHANLLKRYTGEVYLTFDSDGAGVRAAIRAIPILKEAGISARVIDMKPYKDPDEFIKALGAEAYQERIDHAQNSFLFEIGVLEQDYDLKDPEGKTKFYREVARRLADFSEELERTNYMSAIAERYQIGMDALRKLVIQEAGKGRAPHTIVRQGSGKTEMPKKEDGLLRSWKLLLTWLVEDPNLFGEIGGILGPGDFTEEPYAEVAHLLFAQCEGGEVNPAKIVSHFEDEERQRDVAAMFHERLEQVETPKEREKALKDTLLRVKENSIVYRINYLKTHLGDDPTNVNELNRLAGERMSLPQRIQSLSFR